MRLTKIYTKVGDKGTTLLANGERVSKAALRIEAYGTLDELNAVVGLLRDHLASAAVTDHARFDRQLAMVQNELFDLGSELATPVKALDTTRQLVVGPSEIARLEQEMDRMNETLPPLANFVLPGGHVVNSQAHLARTVCRRAERRLVQLREDEAEVRPETQIYLNRLSDWLFVLSRALSHALGVAEVLWDQRKAPR